MRYIRRGTNRGAAWNFNSVVAESSPRTSSGHRGRRARADLRRALPRGARRGTDEKACSSTRRPSSIDEDGGRRSSDWIDGSRSAPGGSPRAAARARTRISSSGTDARRRAARTRSSRTRLNGSFPSSDYVLLAELALPGRDLGDRRSRSSSGACTQNRHATRTRAPNELAEWFAPGRAPGAAASAHATLRGAPARDRRRANRPPHERRALLRHVRERWGRRNGVHMCRGVLRARVHGRATVRSGGGGGMTTLSAGPRSQGDRAATRATGSERRVVSSARWIIVLRVGAMAASGSSRIALAHLLHPVAVRARRDGHGPALVLTVFQESGPARRARAAARTGSGGSRRRHLEHAPSIGRGARRRLSCSPRLSRVGSSTVTRSRTSSARLSVVFVLRGISQVPIALVQKELRFRTVHDRLARSANAVRDDGRDRAGSQRGRRLVGDRRLDRASKPGTRVLMWPSVRSGRIRGNAKLVGAASGLLSLRAEPRRRQRLPADRQLHRRRDRRAFSRATHSSGPTRSATRRESSRSRTSLGVEPAHFPRVLEAPGRARALPPGLSSLAALHHRPLGADRARARRL